MIVGKFGTARIVSSVSVTLLMGLRDLKLHYLKRSENLYVSSDFSSLL